MKRPLTCQHCDTGAGNVLLSVASPTTWGKGALRDRRTGRFAKWPEAPRPAVVFVDSHPAFGRGSGLGSQVRLCKSCAERAIGRPLTEEELETSDRPSEEKETA